MNRGVEAIRRLEEDGIIKIINQYERETEMRNDLLGAVVDGVWRMLPYLGNHMGPIETLTITTNIEVRDEFCPNLPVASWPEWDVRGERWSSLFGPHPLVDPTTGEPASSLDSIVLYAD